MVEEGSAEGMVVDGTVVAVVVRVESASVPSNCGKIFSMGDGDAAYEEGLVVSMLSKSKSIGMYGVRSEDAIELEACGRELETDDVGGGGGGGVGRG